MRSRRMMTLAFCALMAAPLLSQDQMKPGQWQITTQMDMPGMPVKMPANTVTSCVTPEQARTPGSTVDPGGGRGRGNNDCKTSDEKIDGNKITWKMACTGANAMTGDGEMVFNGDSYTGKVNMSMAAPAGAAGRGFPTGAMTLQVTGKRIGDCPK